MLQLKCEFCGNTETFFQRARVTELQEIDGNGHHVNTLETYDCDIVPDSYECGVDGCGSDNITVTEV